MAHSMEDYIVVRNARLHNLKNVSVKIPIGKITLVSGVSGSGKSTLVVDIIGKILGQKYLDLLGETNQSHSVMFLQEEEYVDLIEPLCPVILFKGLIPQRNPQSTVATITGLNRLIRNLFYFHGDYICPRCGEVLKANEPEQIVAAVLDAANDRRVTVKAPLFMPASHDEKRMALYRLQSEGYLRLEVNGRVFMLDEEIQEALDAVNQEGCKANLIIDRIKLGKGKTRRLFDSIRTALQEGRGKVACDIESKRGEFETFYFSTSLWCFRCQEPFIDTMNRDRRTKDSDLSQEASLVFLGKRLEQILKASVTEVIDLMSKAENVGAIRKKDATYPIFQKILSQLISIDSLGIGYLNLSRQVTEVSAGEFLKLRLSSLLAHKCMGVLFILDEPVSILPSRERQQVCGLIERLKNGGNTVVMIEHAPEAYEIADYFIETGPGGGEAGGRVITQHWLDDTKRKSLLRELKNLIPHMDFNAKSTGKEFITVGLSDYFHPGKEIHVARGALNVITGPTGSGKSRLLSEIRSFLEKGFAHEHLVLDVPQGAIFRNRYSMPCTVLNVFGKIRGLFSGTKEARGYGLTSQMFSLSKKGGRCEMCKGTGQVEKEGLGYLASYICPLCKGSRYNPDILQVLYKGLNISEVLDLSISQAADFFSNVAVIRYPLEIAERVGIGYLRLGQPLSSLSAGESQRLKVASHLVRRGSSRQGFILLDQPTSGLHPKDVTALVDFFKELILLGSTLIIAENNPALFDWAACKIRLYGAGPEGGYIVSNGK